MKTLLQPGDKIKIRADIKQAKYYKMKTTEVQDTWIRANMVQPGETVTIRRVFHGRYQVEEDKLCSYTDEMFEPDLIEFLYQDYLNNK